MEHLRKKTAFFTAEQGFTLIELLVVMVILGILAAIALPAFFNQKSKASDARAKEYVHSAQVAAEAFSLEHGGSYASITKSALEGIEPTLSSASNLSVTTIESGAGYKVEVEGAGSAQKFWAERTRTGGLLFECTTGGKGGCPTGGSWAKG